jgi:hypothetical protein
MKTFTLLHTHIILFESVPKGRASFQINELVDEDGHIHFCHGSVGHAADMVNIPGVTYVEINRILPKAQDLFQAKASLVELIIEGHDSSQKMMDEFSLGTWLRKKGFPIKPPEQDSVDFRPLMRELKDLPLLVGFFKNPATQIVFEEVLKNG